MTNAEKLNELPACPVETTLTIISDKWKVLILRDLMTGKKTFRRTEKIHWERITESTDFPAAPDGRKRCCIPQGLPGSSATG